MKRVLVIDDDPNVVEVITVNLEAEGYEVETAVDGRDAWAHLLAALPDVVILDWMLPGRSGIDLLGDLRADPKTRDIPVVLLSAKARDEEIWAGWQAGANYYLTKPFKLEVVEELLELERRGQVVVGARLPAGPDLLVAGLGREEDDRDVLGVGVGAQVVEQVDPTAPRQHPVEDDDVGQARHEVGPRRPTVDGGLDRVALGLQVDGDDLDDVGVVVDDEHPFHGWVPANEAGRAGLTKAVEWNRGRIKVNVAPPPTVSVSSSSPSNSSASRRQR